MNVQVSVVQNRTVIVDSQWQFDNYLFIYYYYLFIYIYLFYLIYMYSSSESLRRCILHRLLKHQSLAVNIQDYVHPDKHTQPTYEMTPGFKSFTK